MIAPEDMRRTRVAPYAGAWIEIFKNVASRSAM